MYKAFILVLSICLLLNSCDVRKKDVAANSVPGSEQAPISKFKPTTVQIIDSTYNFGQIPEGKVVEYNFKFRNTGNEPLEVTQASASCGCTVPEKPTEPIKPGEIGFIKVKFDSDKRPGQVKKSITVTSNAEPPFPVLYLEGEVLGKKEE
jgi:hypothetical protein